MSTPRSRSCELMVCPTLPSPDLPQLFPRASGYVRQRYDSPSLSELLSYQRGASRPSCCPASIPPSTWRTSSTPTSSVTATSTSTSAVCRRSLTSSPALCDLYLRPLLCLLHAGQPPRSLYFRSMARSYCRGWMGAARPAGSLDLRTGGVGRRWLRLSSRRRTSCTSVVVCYCSSWSSCCWSFCSSAGAARPQTTRRSSASAGGRLCMGRRTWREMPRMRGRSRQ
jgi:hypothetical protein